MRVRLAGTQLVAAVPDDAVFWYTDDDHRDESNKARCAAWDKVRYRAAPEPWMTKERLDNVFNGVIVVGPKKLPEEGRPCWFRISKEIYDPLNPPKPALTDAQVRSLSQLRAAQEAKEARAAQKASHQKKLEALFEFIPKLCSGVDWGAEGRILIKTKSRVLVYRKGHTSYLDRGAGNAYNSGDIRVHDYTRKEGRYRLSSKGGGLGIEIALPDKWRLSPKGFKQLYSQIEGEMNLPKGFLADLGFDGTKTINLDSIP